MATTHDPLAPSTTPGMAGHEGANGKTLKHKFSEATSHVRHTAADFGRSAKENLDRNLRSAADALENTASAIRQRLPQGEGTVAGIASTTANKLDSTARYMREHDSSDLYHDVENWARRSPGAAIGTAAVLGFLLGMTLRRDRSQNW